jgi:uncharacterized flavoprotein (TIGR03862 family)
MAAETLAAAGLSVTVHEHRASVGRKLLLAGRSGLNLTHSEPSSQMMKRYGHAAPRLAGAISNFDAAALRAWSAALGEPTFAGSSGRVFPESFRATPLLRAWLARLAAMGVMFEVRDRWMGWVSNEKDQSFGTTIRFEREGETRDITTDVVVLALGGASWPRVGSDGGWAATMRDRGVAVTPFEPANCGVHVLWSSHFANKFAGVPLKNVALRVLGHDVGGDTGWVRGDVTVTERGLESGPVYTVSAAVRRALRDGVCTLDVDLQPDLTLGDAADRLRNASRPKDSRSTTLRRALGLSAVAVGLIREAAGPTLRTDALDLATIVKAVPIQIVAIESIERAISTAGGIAFDEIDDQFMLRKIPGTFVAGEMIDWEAPTGGYLLQACFSTGVAAARGAIAWLDAQVDGALHIDRMASPDRGLSVLRGADET